MVSFLIGLFLIMPSFSLAQSDSVEDEELYAIIEELELTLDNFFALQQEEDLDLFIAGVRHAARARLLLEQLLGEDIDQTGSRASTPAEDYNLKLIARRVQDLSGELGKELWRQDFEDKQTALLRLSELENLTKGLKNRVAVHN